MKNKISLIIILFISIISFAQSTTVESQVAIYEGWNLIHGFTPSSPQGDLDLSNVKAIYSYLPNENKYVRLYPNPESPIIAKYGDSYFEKQVNWVYSDKTIQGSFNNMPHGVEYWLEEPLPLNERPLSVGWNFVGVLPDMYMGTYNPNEGYAGEYFSWMAIKGNCEYEKIYYWNAEKQEWGTMDPGMQLKSYDFDDFLSNGMLVKVKNSCALNKIIGGSNPPAIPN